MQLPASRLLLEGARAAAMACALVTGFAGAPAGAQPLPGSTETTKLFAIAPGEDLRVYEWAFFDADCRATVRPRFDVVRPPRHGVLRTTNARVAIRRTEGNQACSGRRIPGTALDYRPAPGFTGHDKFTFRRVAPDGSFRTFTVRITVR